MVRRLRSSRVPGVLSAQRFGSGTVTGAGLVAGVVLRVLLTCGGWFGGWSGTGGCTLMSSGGEDNSASDVGTSGITSAGLR